MPVNVNDRVWRFDYAKFKFVTSSEHFNELYAEIKAAARLFDAKADFSKSHKINVFRNTSHTTYDYFVDIWGEFAGLVQYLPREPYFNCLKRCDVRAHEFDLTNEEIVYTGQVLQRPISQYNINVYSTRETTKRMGKDRGGKGFAIGSHKSDLRITYYKRKGEVSAVEYQFAGQKLITCLRSVLAVDEELHFGTSSWLDLKGKLSEEGGKRERHVFAHAGLDHSSFVDQPPLLSPSMPLL